MSDMTRSSVTRSRVIVDERSRPSVMDSWRRSTDRRARFAVPSTIASGVQQLGIEIRAGVHTGEVAFEGDDISGIAVAIGARVGAKARASEVLVSRTVKDLVAGSGLVFEDTGEYELKGVPDRWHLYRVVDGE